MASGPANRGQIVLIRLKNFMSYDEIELRPGFNLNLIVGPNGTGKSTFVCAVVLGLGGKLKTLGRADNISSYVKTGCHESSIEIELYDPLENNVLITRKISSDNHSEFYINGKITSASKVNDIRVKYNILLDNLCTFLPQEKVQDFSKLNPQALLDSTQRTIGRDDLIQNFAYLKKLQKKIRDKEKEYKSITTKIEELKSKNDAIEDKVKRYRDGKVFKDKLYKATQKKTWLVYYETVLEVEELKADYERAEEKFKRDKADFDLYNSDIAKIEAEINFFYKMYEDAKVIYDDKVKFMRGEVIKFRKVIEQFENIETRTERKLRDDELKRRELDRFHETLDKLKNDLKSFVSKNGEEDQLDSSERIIAAEIAKSRRDEKRTKGKKNEIEDDVNNVQMEIRNLSVEYRFLDSRRHARLEYLKRHEPDVYKTVEWLKSNRRLFRGRVYGPMAMELDLTDRKYAKYVESCVAYRDLIAFVCSNADDLNLLIAKVRGEMKLHINGIVAGFADPYQYHPRIPLKDISHMGFTCYMKDLIVGPGSIIAYLCRVYKVHQIPIAEGLEYLSCENVPSAISVYFTENQMYSIKTSFYSRDKSVTLKQLDEPRILNKPLTCGRIEEVREKQLELCDLLTHKEMKLRLAMHFVASVMDRLNFLRLKQRHLSMLRSELHDIKFKIKLVETNISIIKSFVKGQDAIYEESRKERQILGEQIRVMLVNLLTHFEDLQRIARDVYENELKQNFFNIKAHNVSDINWEVRETYLRQKEVRDQKKSIYFKRKVECKRLKKHAERLTQGIGPGDAGFEEFENEFKNFKGTIPQLEIELREAQVMTEFCSKVDVKIVEEYEDRETEIATLKSELDKAVQRINEAKEEIDYFRDMWLVPINELVSQINAKFSSFFESVGCVGEVCLITGENEDHFDEYGISIRVKFRDDIPLQTLGRHFQSGGERAMATAVYLLSLQELVSVPFRFVDEINQGMDSINEKRIIDHMIEVTDKDKSTQYFFISPKLLPGIECSETMVTHCIYSGRNAIPSAEWNLDKFLDDN